MRRLLPIGATGVLAPAIAGAAAVAAVVIGLGAGSGAPSLVDRADAAINVRDQVLHEVDVSDYASTRYGVSYNEDEGWLLPADGRGRVIQFDGYKRARYVSDLSEWIITATGRVVRRVCFAYCRVSSFINGRSRWAYEGTERTLQGLGFGLFPGTLPGELAREFRAAYRVHAAVPKGITTFAGKRVKSFQSMEAAVVGTALVYWQPGTSPPVRVRDAHPPTYALVDWYIDRATAELVGFKTWGCAAGHIRSCKARGAPDNITRIVTFQRLDPTPKNLAQLTGPNAPRGAP